MNLQDKVTALIEDAVGYGLVGGANVLVEQNGREVLYAQGGYADVENRKSMQRDNIFRMYSMSKVSTSLATMILMERGKLDLYQNIADFIPEYRQMEVVRVDGSVGPMTRYISVKNLLDMTSGISYPGCSNPSDKGSALVFDEACARLRTDNEMSTMELAKKLAAYPLAYEPGTSWRYGASADVLGAVIEAVTGQKYADFMAKEIFEPLGMKDTAFYVPADKRDRFANTYETIWGSEGGHLIPYTGDNLAINNSMDREPAFASGGAGLASTLDDYMQLCRMLINNGVHDGKQFIKPETVRFMTTGALTDICQKDFNWDSLIGHTYGNLLRVCDKPGQTAMITRQGEYGWDGWLGVYMANFPNEKLTFLMGTQKRDAGTFDLTRRIRNVILSELL